ncbi:hypothetical protein [Amycolatopsis kentuckyensis]|uniref:hypothetical protein n=1 Tax=Amycolatopsis kentuckyensis TaxID=218823 RepID=UPI000A3C2445|nr:hypothetical protein [Amycolatopsis kentuckyensis]
MTDFDIDAYDQALAAAHQNLATAGVTLAALRLLYSEPMAISTLATRLQQSWPAEHLASTLAAAVAKLEETR